jgi:hypothetical protein
MSITNNATGTGAPGNLPGDPGSTYDRIDGPPYRYRKMASGWIPADVIADDGIVPIGTLPVGTGANQVAAGDHSHSGAGDVVGGSTSVDGEIAAYNGTTGKIIKQSFVSFSGPATSVKTYTLPNASVTILTTNALVTVAQGGSGANTLTGILKGNGTSAFTAATAGTDYTSPTSTETMTNKRITSRTSTSATNNTTPTPNADTDDLYIATGMSVNMVFGAPTGTPTEGQKLIIRIKDSGSARTLDFNAAYRFSTDLAKPTTTVISKTMYLGFLWTATDSKWDCVSKIENF